MVGVYLKLSNYPWKSRFQGGGGDHNYVTNYFVDHTSHSKLLRGEAMFMGWDTLYQRQSTQIYAKNNLL